MFLRIVSKLTDKASGAKVLQTNAKGFHNYMDIHPEVASALSQHKPVVALESTIITHGMPYPRNLETALEVEDVVRSVGATPATIACVGGRLKVGITTDDVRHLSEPDKMEVLKCSRRDLPYVVANCKSGGTTVAATMIIAHMAGIRIFATGGVGGVHREGHVTMDISADLVELGRTPVVVVSSGVKSILDIPRTLEYLETQGVCLASYDNEGQFPDFYSRDSGCVAPYNLRGPKDAARLIKAMEDLELRSGVLIGVPIPKQYAVDKIAIQTAIEQAYTAASSQGIEGKNVTPFMLAEIAKITDGNSLRANIALIKNNAKIAAQIACELQHIKLKKSEPPITYRPMIIGASILDLCLTMLNDEPLALDGATYKTQAKESAGGVGRNLAEGIMKLHGGALFLSVVGKDHMGKHLLELMPDSLSSGIHVAEEQSTSLCSILLDTSGNCKLCLANMEIHKSITPELIMSHEEDLRAVPLIVMDGNLSVDAMTTILKLCRKHNKPAFFEPTDMLIAGKPFTLEGEQSERIRFISPNVFELKAIVETLTGNEVSWNPSQCAADSDIQQLLKNCKGLLEKIESGFDCIVVTLGAHGVLVNVRGNDINHSFFDGKTAQYHVPDALQFTKRYYAAPPVSAIVNVSGAGDSFSSGFITGILRGLNVEESVAFGFVAATRSLQSESAVPHQYFRDNQEETTLLRKQLISLKSIKV